MTAPARAATAIDDIRVARVHLRLGQLTLARAELEDLLGRDALDPAGLTALAEARWRTGDSDGAADAAEAHLEAGGQEDVALCIAAEAAAAEGRASDARKLMDRLVPADAATLDAIFAGMPRRAFWPTAPAEPADLDEIRRRPAERRSGIAAVTTPSPNAAQPRAIPGPREVLDATAAGDWAGDVAAPGRPAGAAGARGPAGRQPGAGRRVRGQLDPMAELDRAHAEMATRPERAILRLALVLRADPTLAPAVLDALYLRREPAAALLRGDAQRLLGRHLEAEAAFDTAAESLEGT